MINNTNQFIKIKKTTTIICATALLGLGYIAGNYSGAHTNSDNREVKFPHWEVAETVAYKKYAFTHIDYFQPQYVNTIINETMLKEVQEDIKKGKLSVANKSLGVNIGDIVKFTADDSIWLVISSKDTSHKLVEIENVE